MSKPQRYSAEVWGGAVGMVRENEEGRRSEWAAISSIEEEIAALGTVQATRLTAIAPERTIHSGAISMSALRDG